MYSQEITTIYIQKLIGSNFTQFLNLYIIMMAFLSYGEFGISVFMLTPLYVIFSLLQAFAIIKALDEIHDQLDESFYAYSTE